jgi:PAS domain S-box-containing protein
MVKSKENKKDKSAHRVLLYVRTAEDVSILQDILAGMEAEGVVSTDIWDLCRRMAQDADAVLLTEQSLADEALPILAEALQSQPEWSDLPILFVATGGIESPLAGQAMQELGNVLVLDRPVRIATLASALRMAARVRDKQRQVRDLLEEREQREQRLRQLTEHLADEVEAKTETLTGTIDRLHDEVARRALAEGELQKSTQMLEAFFEHTISPLVFMDRHFNLVRVNEAYARADGKRPEYLVGKNYFALYPSPESQAVFEQVVRTRQPYRAYAKPFTFPDAPERGVTYWNWWLTPLLNDLGEVQLLVLNLEDVTERQKAFFELQERARQLQQLTLELSQTEDRERQRLAEVLHDDLQQLLAAAKFHLGLLSNRARGDRETQGEILEMAGQVREMLQEAINKSRSLSHELSPPGLSHNDLQEAFEWLAQQFQRKHGLTVHLDTRERIELLSEPLRAILYKAAQEMLFNVIKHAGVREAKLRLRRWGGSLYLSVSDKGQGFDAEEPGRTGGFGLLSIQERVKLLGGRVKIRSARGKGSTFLIVVPDSQPPATRAGDRDRDQAARDRPTQEKRQTSSPEHVLRVLLADDHKIVRKGIECMLVDEPDIEIVGQAGNGREAVDLAYQLEPDVIVMDVSMPVMPGDEATRQIKLHLPQTRVVALSMHDEARVMDRMCKAGAAAYLLKTAPSEELLAAIRGPKADSRP